MTCAPTGAYDLDHSTTPEVVRISKASNIVECAREEYNAKKKVFRDEKGV